MAAERSVWVRLKASVTEFTGPMKQAKQAVEDVGTGAENASRKSNSALGGMAKSIRENGDAWTTVGGALSTYGAAVTGLSAAVLGVGISYNTMRQQSVAALTTLTGSAEAANAQMDKLDDFASNSPFARDVFIRAQQQLIGFGFAAEDVVPILGAIEDAVAATGGSNQDIEELVGIIARIGSTGKISADDLNQLGTRGVDAATIIGDAFGLSGAEIREAITAGTLDADDAITALVSGMDSKFGGAAENVKGTMLGAADRVKAAFRDIGAEFASVLVDPQGGGLLVDGFNALADALRAFQDLPTPIKNTVGALAGLSGVASLAAGGFMMLAPRAVETWDALGKMGRVGSRAQGALRGVGRMATRAAGPLMLGGLLITLSKIGDEMNDFELSASEAENRLRTLGDASGDALFSFEIDGDFQEFLGELGSDAWWRPLHGHLADFGDGLAGLFRADTRSDFYKFRDDMVGFDDALSSMAGESLPEAVKGFNTLAAQTDGSNESLLMLLDVLPGFREYLVGVANELEITANDANLLKIATGEIKPPVDEATDSLSLLADEAETTVPSLENLEEAADNVETAMSDLRREIEGWGSPFRDQRAAARRFEQQLDDLAEAMRDEEWATGLDKTTQAGRDNEEMLDDLAQSSLDWVSAAAEGGASTEEMTGIMARGREEFIEAAKAMGLSTEAAEDLADQMGLIPENVPIAVETSGIEEAEQALSDLQAEAEVSIEIPLSADATEAQSEVEEFRLKMAETNGVVKFDADGELAYVNLELWEEHAKHTTGMPKLDADPALAEQQILDYLGLAKNTTGTAKLAADDALAESTRKAWKWLADNTFGTAKLKADDSLAQQSMTDFFTRNSGKVIKVGMSYGFNSGGGMADGGIIQRANGGIDQAGNPIVRQSMMGGPQYGRTNILWGEPETGWEAYISGKPGQESRNRAVLEEAAHRMGMTVLDGLGTQRFADGGLNKTMPTTLKFSGGPTGDGGIERAMRDWLDHNPAAAGRLGMGWRAQWNIIKSLVPSAILTSAYRPGAITSSGYRSYHGLGRAVDLAGPMWQIFSILRQAFPQSRELYYSPAGFMQLQNGRPHYPTGITRAQHWDHVHWAMDKGGILDALANPKAADTGMTTLNPGYNLRYNGLGRDEHMVDVERFRTGPMQLASEAAGVAELRQMVDTLGAAVASIPDRIEVPVQVDSREVAYANRRGEQSFGAPGQWSGAPRLGRSSR